MKQLWTQLKRRGLPLVTRIGLAMPLLLVLAAVLMLVAIWWLGPQWTWREQRPLASIAHRGLASLVLVLIPLVCWLVVLRRRFRHLQAERNQAAAVELDQTLPFVQAQEKALDQGLSRFLHNAGGRRALYRLPWYLVVGDQHAGKTNFLDRTEQSFSLTRIDKARARGRPVQALTYPIGWWISNDAVIIDPPGAFISQGLGSLRLPRKQTQCQYLPPLRPDCGSTSWTGCCATEARDPQRCAAGCRSACTVARHT